MSEQTQPNPVPFSRPSARPGLTAMPVQRGNYGIPTRQVPVAPVQPSGPAPAMPPQPGPRLMDVAVPRPSQPAQPTQQPTQPVGSPVSMQNPGVPTPAAAIPAQPTFNATPKAVEEKANKPAKLKLILSKLCLVLLIVGALISLVGIARWATAGSIANDTIAVGAVTANDGNTISIQFTADDGQLHKFTIHGNQSALIPGTAVQVAYQPGAPDHTAKQVSKVKSAHNLGVSLFFTGVLLLIVGGGLGLFVRRHTSHKSTTARATPVTA